MSMAGTELFGLIAVETSKDLTRQRVFVHIFVVSHSNHVHTPRMENSSVCSVDTAVNM